MPNDLISTPLLLVAALAILASLVAAFALRWGHSQKALRLLSVRRVVQLGREFGLSNHIAKIDQLTDGEWNGVIAEVTNSAANDIAEQGSAGLLGRELKRLYTLLDALGDGIVVLDRENVVLYANATAEPFLKVAPSDVAGKSASECFLNEEVASLLGGASGNNTVDIEASAEAGHAHTLVSCRAGGNGVIENAGHVLQFQDVSKLRDVEASQREFVDSVVHEMRTPLTSIRAYVELLIDGEAADPEAERNFYNIIYEETDRLSQLIDNLLNISMMEGGMIDLNTTPTRIKRVLEETVDVVRPQCAQKKITLEIDLPDRLPTMDIDKQLFSVAFMNIISNAVKYTPDGGTVNLSTSSHEDELHIVVRDSGIGISEEDMARIFEKFFRAKGAQSEQGSGVGLATAREIVRLHGGDIRVQSTPGEGSQFTIVMPRTLVNTSIGD